MVTSRNPVVVRDEAPNDHWIVGNHRILITFIGGEEYVTENRYFKGVIR